LLKTILSPRPLTREQTELAIRLNLRVLELDAISVQHTPGEALAANWPRPRCPFAVVFTSANAVNAIVAGRMLRPATQEPEVVVAIGPKTSARLDVFGIMAAAPPEPTAQALGQWLPAALPRIRAVVHPCAANARPELAEALAHTSVAYYPVVAYDTHCYVAPARMEGLASRQPSALLATSPAVADALLAAWPAHTPLPQVVAIGPTTAQHLQRRGVACTIAPDPSLEAMLCQAAGAQPA
jgi:uroporphyrinogen-III synthase